MCAKSAGVIDNAAGVYYGLYMGGLGLCSFIRRKINDIGEIKMDFGVQLFGCAALFRADPAGFLRSVAEAGYRQVEPCIAFSSINLPAGMINPFWALDELDEFVGLLKQNGLSLGSCHAFGDLLANIEAVKKAARDYEIGQIVIGLPRENLAEQMEGFCDMAARLAAELEKIGVGLWLHNSYAEISEKVDGVSVYEAVLKQCGGKVGAQVDAGWVQYGGEDPVSFMERIKPYIRSVHYKDLKKNYRDLPGAEIHECLGVGCLDVKAIFNFAKALNVPQLIDQDNSDNGMMNDLKSSAELLRSFDSAGVVDLKNLPKAPEVISLLETVNVDTGERRVLKKFDYLIEAPNWTHDGKYLIYNSAGRIYRFDLATLESELIDTSICTRCNNDHVLSFDGRMLAVSHMEISEGFSSRIYVVPVEGGEAVQVSSLSPSFLHGISPDGKTFAYCGMRANGADGSGRTSAEVYLVEMGSDDERQLTFDSPYSDGPEYTPDGKYIWYNSTKSGLMQLWRMDTDGKNQRQMTFDESNSWFAHISPDGRRVAYITYKKGDVEPWEHLANKDVELRLMSENGGDFHTVAKVFGGQGTLNVNSWSPDNETIAFVSYELK